MIQSVVRSLMCRGKHWTYSPDAHDFMRFVSWETERIEPIGEASYAYADTAETLVEGRWSVPRTRSAQAGNKRTHDSCSVQAMEISSLRLHLLAALAGHYDRPDIRE